MLPNFINGFCLQYNALQCKIDTKKTLAVFLLRQIWIVKYSVKYSTVDCKYLLFLQDFFFKLKPRQYKNANIPDCFKKSGNS